MIDFNKMIDNYLYRDFSPKKAGRYYPSEIGGCLRKIWYTYKFPLATQPELIKIFELGNLLHDFVVRVLNSEKNPEVQLLKSEFPLVMDVDDFVISGRVDDVLLLKVSGKQILVEVKSCKSVDFVNAAQPQHVAQLQFYMHATEIKDGVMLYVDKTSLKSKVFTVPYNETTAQSVISRFRSLNKNLKENTLPPAEAKARIETKWMCKWCEYADKCERNET